MRIVSSGADSSSPCDHFNLCIGISRSLNDVPECNLASSFFVDFFGIV